METWKPLLIGLGIAVALNAFPYVMAFVIRVEGWAQIGWIFYLLTIPIGLLCIAVGLVISLL